MVNWTLLVAAANAMARLLLSLFLVVVISDRPSTEDGLQGVRYLPLIILVLGAWFAGRHWHNGPVYLVYGAAGTSGLIYSYLSSSNVGYALAHDDMGIVAPMVWCTLGAAAVAVVCNEAGRTARWYATECLPIETAVFDPEPGDDPGSLASCDSGPMTIDRDILPTRPS